MTQKAAIAAAFLVIAGTPVFAQVTGGELGIEYNAPTDGSDFGGTTYFGGMEYSVAPTLSISINAADYQFDYIDTDANNLTLHATYHLSSAASAGAFYARDNISGELASIYGIEGGTEFMGGDIGGYIGHSTSDIADATLYGIDGSYMFGGGFSMVGDADLLSSQGQTVSQVSVGGEYALERGPSFYARVGRVEGSFQDWSQGSSEGTFVTVGAKVAFGAQRGTTFSNRSFFEVIPGF